MANRDIKDAIYYAKLRNYEVAEMCGWSEPTFYRKMRHELPDAVKAEIFEKINEYTANHTK